MKYDDFLKKDKKEKKRHPPRHFESNIQKQIIMWFRLCYPHYIIAAVPNGGYRNAIEAKHMKGEGVLAGFSDLIIIVSKNILFVEIKTLKGVQSVRQKEFQAKLSNLGFEYKICHSLNEFIFTIEDFIKRKCTV